MNEAKFSKGDWVYVESSSTVYDEEGEFICDTHSTGEEWEEANGYLLAQANKMYHELQGLLSVYMDCEDYDRIKKLLSKARGE